MHTANDDRTLGALRSIEPAMTLMKKMIEAPQSARGIRRWMIGALASVAMVAACEGDNLFTGTSNEFSPQVQGLSLPSIAYAGENFSIRVDAAASRGVSQILLSLAGAVEKDTVVTLNEAPSRISRVVQVAVPTILADTVILVQVAVVDKLGDVSASREGSVVVFGPPSVTSLSAPAIVRLGELVSLRVTAFGARKITQLVLLASGAIQKDTTVTVSPARTNVTQDIILAIPNTAQDTLLRLSVSARDESGQGGAVVSRTIPLVVDPPFVELVSPAVARAGMMLDVQVLAQGVRKISEVRVELRGAVTRDVTVAISPSQSNIVQNVAIALPGDIRLSDLRARAAVIDRGQVMAYSEEDLITIPLGPPAVLDVEVPLVAYRGRLTDIRVRATGDRPLTEIQIRFRGAADSTKTYSVDPIRLDVVQDAWVGIADSTSSTTLIVMVTARDVSGAVSEIVSRTLTVENPTEPDLAMAEPRLESRAVPFHWSPTRQAAPRTGLWFDPAERSWALARPGRGQ